MGPAQAVSRVAAVHWGVSWLRWESSYCCDSTSNLLTSWPFSFIFSGGRSPALKFWLSGFKSNIPRDHTDSSHDTVASLGMCIPSRPQGCAGWRRRPVNTPSSICSQSQSLTFLLVGSGCTSRAQGRLITARLSLCCGCCAKPAGALL